MDDFSSSDDRRPFTTYLIRYGSMGQVGPFAWGASDLRRGQTVVIRSHRGTELGEVLVPRSSPSTSSSEQDGSAYVVRVATKDDLARAQQVEGERQERLALCQSVFDEGIWPLELIDVEPLLEERRTVLHYLGPHGLDTVGLLTVFRTKYGLDIMLQPAGKDVPDIRDAEEEDASGGCGHCGSDGGCGSGGGCGSDSSSEGCSSCGVKGLLSKRRVTAGR